MKSSFQKSNLDSDSSLMLDGLDEAQQSRLIGLLDGYLIGVEEGRSQDVEAMIAAHPDLETPLRQYLEGLDWLRQFKLTVDAPDVNSLSSSIAASKALLQSSLREYELGDELGRGAMGIVYSATNRSNGEFVAIKVLSFGSLADAGRVERFRREALAAESLHHPNIVHVQAIGCENGIHFYVMQRIEGDSVAQRITKGEHFDCRMFAREFAKVAEAIHAAHASGIIHRDIKPSNLLMDGEHRIWVTDFGLAHMDNSSQLTRSGDLVGTFHYMSPEQASGHPESIDCRTDVYSLGATLYEVFAGRPPFSGWTGPALLKQIQTSEPPRLRQLVPNIPPDLETIIRRAMRPEKADRYMNASEMAKDLERFSNGKKIHASRVTLHERATRLTAKNAAIVAIGFVATLICLVALLAHSMLLQKEKSRTDAALRLADRNYQNARQVVDTLGMQVADHLLLVPGSETVRREILAESLAYYRLFINDSNTDPRLSSDVAQTHLKIARLVSTAGNVTDAEQAYSDAIKSLQVANQQNGNVSIATSLNQAINEWAMLASQQGNSIVALKRLNQANEVIEQSLTGNDRIKLESLVHNNRAIVSLRAGEMPTALSESQLAVKLLRSLPESEIGKSSSDDLDGAIADSLSNWSVILASSGDEANAIEPASKAIEIRRRLSNVSNSPDRLRRLALAYNNLAALDWRRKNLQSSIVSYQEGVRLLEQAIKQLPGQLEPQRELSVTLNNLGMALASTENTKDAEAVFRRALAIACPAADADLKNADAAHRTAGIWNNLGILLKNRYSVEDARRAFEKAQLYQQRTCSLLPQDQSNKLILEQIQNNLASIANGRS